MPADLLGLAQDQHFRAPVIQVHAEVYILLANIRLGAEAGLGRGGGLPTQEACLRQPSKSLHDLDSIPQLCRTLQLGLGRVGWWQIAIAGQPVLDHRREPGKQDELERCPLPTAILEAPPLAWHPGSWNPGGPVPVTACCPSQNPGSPALGCVRTQQSCPPPPHPYPSTDLQIPDPNLMGPRIWVPRPHPQSLFEQLNQPPAPSGPHPHPTDPRSPQTPALTTPALTS